MTDLHDRWEDQAACRNALADGLIPDADNDPWFPKGNAELSEQALAYCAICPVRRECRGEADSLRSRYGSWAEAAKMQSVWGGEVRGTVERGAPADRLAAMNGRRRQLWEVGMTDLEMATVERVTVGAIGSWRSARGLAAHPSTVPNRVTERRREWHSWGWTDQKMADADGVDVNTIIRWRDRWHLPVNSARRSNQRAG